MVTLLGAGDILPQQAFKKKRENHDVRVAISLYPRLTLTSVI